MSSMDELKPKKKFGFPRFVFIGVGIVFSFMIVIIAWLYFIDGRDSTIQLVNYRSEKVVERSVSDVVRLRTLYEPRLTTNVETSVDGTISKILKSNGDRVVAGEILVELVNEDLNLDNAKQRQALDSQLLQAQRSLSLAKENLLDSRSNVARLNFDLATAEEELRQNEGLFGKKLISDAAVAKSRNQVALRTEQLSIEKDSLSLKARSVQNFENELSNVRSNTNLLAKSLINREARLKVRAVSDGVLNGFEPKLGQRLRQGDRLGTIIPQAGFELTGRLSEFYLGRIKVGNSVTLPEYPSLSLKVSEIDTEVIDGRFQVRLDGPLEDQGTPTFGQGIDAMIVVDEKVAVPSVSRRFVDSLPDGDRVHVLSQEGINADVQVIKFGLEGLNYVEVLDGAKVGDTLINTNNEYLEVLKVER